MSLFTRKKSDSVAALGEENLIASIRRWLGSAAPESPVGMGDDCAVLPLSAKQQLITVDPVVYGRHFDDKIAPCHVSEKLLKRNLSDIAAMGGKPTAAVIALTLDPRTKLAWLEAFYRGLAACARKYDVRIVGGDIAQADHHFSASLTLIGEATSKRVLTRQGAKIGDWLYVTGRLGGSLASGHHYRFKPRLTEGAWLAKQHEVRSMMDLSDGLGKDLRSITPNDARARLNQKALPLNKKCDVRAALTDGEDYELLFAVSGRTKPETFLRKWRNQFPRAPLFRIGEFVSINDAAAEPSLNLECYFGYEHLR
jgi:thiamine-monophosphate kinase